MTETNAGRAGTDIKCKKGMDATIAIAQIRPDETEAIKQLNRLVLDHDGGYIPGPWDDDLDRIHHTYLERCGDFLVARAGKKVIGMGALLRVNSDLAEIKRIRVHPEYQRQGIAQRILERLEQTAIELGYRTLELDTLKRQPNAIALFERNGYTWFGVSDFEGSKQRLYRKLI